MSARVRAFASAIVPIAIALGPAAAESAPGPSIAPGSRGVMRTVIGDRGLEEVPVRFIGTLRNWIGPGRNVYLVELEGPVAEQVGVASGMSGSPVFVEGRLVGALAYRYGALPRRAIGGVTPIEDVWAAGDDGGGASAPASAPGLGPIATPVTVSGLVEPVRRWLEPRLQQVGLVAVSGGAMADSPPREPYPGMPVGVRLVGGDLVIAATGTVTWVDGQTLYAFGHPFLGAGRTELPMVHAEVVHTMPDMAGSFKLTNVGGVFGAIVGDRLTGIVGRVGGVARVIPMEVTLRGGAYRKRRFHFEISPHSTLTPLLAASAVANAMLRDTGFDDAMTILGDGTIHLDGLDDIPISLAFSGEGNSNPALALAGRLQSVLSALFQNPFGPPPIRSIELSFDIALDRHEYRVEEVLYDRGPVVPGGVLSARCVLRGYRGERFRHALSVPIPEDLAPGTRLVLAVGSESWIRGASRLGVAERLRSATDLPSLVRALAELEPANRLAAVLYRAGTSVVSSGTVLEGLPGSAGRLLTEPRSTGVASSRVSPLERVSLDLPGPVDGGVALRIDVGVGRSEDE